MIIVMKFQEVYSRVIESGDCDAIDTEIHWLLSNYQYKQVCMEQVDPPINLKYDNAPTTINNCNCQYLRPNTLSYIYYVALQRSGTYH